MLNTALKIKAETPRWWRIVNSIQHFIKNESEDRVREMLDGFVIPERYDPRNLAMLATAVDATCDMMEIDAPEWTADPRTVLDDPYFGRLPHDDLVLFKSPDYALKHNVLLPRNSWTFY
jgi:hypothetical protein